MSAPAVDLDDAMYSLPAEVLENLLRSRLASGGRLRIFARGWSMSPFIRNGDRITLASLGGQVPSLGRVVVFALPGAEALVVHRVVGIRGQAALMRGDNVSQPDGWVQTPAVLGQVLEIERRGRRVRLGLGPERRLLAALSRSGMLYSLLKAVRNVQDWLKIRAST
jgi:hypothetical protein